MHCQYVYKIKEADIQIVHASNSFTRVWAIIGLYYTIIYLQGWYAHIHSLIAARQKVHSAHAGSALGITILTIQITSNLAIKLKLRN